ncbi:Fe2+-dependent dioxygenase [Prochlorococcus sp. MIT 1223]|uniref:Fe2+-dependent dioxygenase n=1 Tax=Prochlorococcus sp. MIT 1223 TaxID=3096217 RepID=UPI002A76413D|nr:Fe2+-dependent dioxygenase [Prochlorococcus sp. MIT 1223]
MDYLIHKLLDKKTAQKIIREILSNQSDWKDGKRTAGSFASKVKNNLQLDRNSELSINASDEITSHMLKDPLIKSFSLAKIIHGLMFSKAGLGQGYGTHIDNPYMSSGRSDLSFTLFLSEKNNYEGGELCIQTMQGSNSFKLDMGEIIIYPSTSLHSVEKVSSGQRIVCVGWIESYVSSNEERSFLFGLEAGAKGLLAKYGQSPELDLIFQSYGNLLRRMGD